MVVIRRVAAAFALVALGGCAMDGVPATTFPSLAASAPAAEGAPAAPGPGESSEPMAIGPRVAEAPAARTEARAEGDRVATADAAAPRPRRSKGGSAWDAN